MEYTADQLLDATIFDTGGERIGSVTDVYVDEGTGQPEWLLLDTGFFARGIHVPAHRLEPHEDGYRLPYAKDVIASSPEVDAGSDELGEVDERRALRLLRRAPRRSARGRARRRGGAPRRP